jgi:hypothetical protein
MYSSWLVISYIAHLSRCYCDHTIDDLGTHLLLCPCGNEHTTTHNTFRNIGTTIVLENGTYVQSEVSHLFIRQTQQQVDIILEMAFELW